MASRKTKTQEKAETKFDISDAEKEKRSEISRETVEKAKIANQTFYGGMASNSVGTWWFLEVWEEHREVFKTLTFHIVFTFIGIVFLLIIHSIIEGSTLPPHKKEILQTIDFWIMTIVLAFFGIEFVYKMVVLVVKSNRDGH